MAQRAAQLASSLIILPLVLHVLGVAGFGIWGAATSLAWLSGLLTLGLGNALLTLLPRGIAAGNTRQNRAYVAAALYGGTAFAGFALLAGAILILGFGVPVRGPFLVAGISLVLNIPLSLGLELWLALQKAHVTAFWIGMQTGLGLLFILAGARLGAGVTGLVAAIFCAMLLANAGSLIHVLWRHAPLRPAAWPGAAALADVARQGGLLFAITLATVCATAFDNVLALAWAGPQASATMAVAMRVCITATGLIAAATQPLWPGFADALAARDYAWARRMLLSGSAAVLVLALAGSALLVLFGAPVLRWWLHQNLLLPRTLLWAMAGWILATSLTQVPGAVLNAALKLKPQIFVLSFAALAGFGLKYFFARGFGAPGILAVTPLLWFLLVVPVFFRQAWLVVA